MYHTADQTEMSNGRLRCDRGDSMQDWQYESKADKYRSRGSHENERERKTHTRSENKLNVQYNKYNDT